MRRRLTRTGNRLAVGVYRRLDGRLSSGRKDVNVLLITVPGRLTGLPRSTCVRFLHTPEGQSSRAPGRVRHVTPTGSETSALPTSPTCR